jgi:uncharacterized repeat protein (TIGR01451 family)
MSNPSGGRTDAPRLRFGRFSKKQTITAMLAAVIAISTGSVATALISTSTGSVIRLSPAPPSVKLNALEHATSVHTFDEKQGVKLGSKITVDAVNPGTYTQFPNGSATIASGTVVDSHLIHSDIPSRNFTTRRQGSVTFAEDILGVIASTNRLGATDSALGAPGTLYSGTTNWRGLESGNENNQSGSFSDKFTISADRRTVTFDLQTLLIDEMRVVTKTKNPLTVAVTDSPDPVQAGNNVTYTIAVTNTATTTANNVQVRDEFPGATFVSASGPAGACTTASTSVTCPLGNLAAGATATASVVVKSPTTVPAGGTITNTATAPPGVGPGGSATTTVAAPVLTTTKSGAPDTVTVGNDVQYKLTVTNDGVAPVANAHLIDTLPAGTTLKEAPANCSGTSTVDCSLGTLAVGQSAEVTLLVTVPNSVPAGGTITNSAVATPGNNTAATVVTTIEQQQNGVSKGWVSPGGSLTIPGDNPATLTLPNTGDGAPVEITQGPGTFCNGTCVGPATTISEFEGYDDPTQPIKLVLTYTFPSTLDDALTDAADAYAATIYKTDEFTPNSGTVVPFCTAFPNGGNAIPHPCVDARTIDDPTPGNYVVTFTILYISGDPRFAKR